MHRWKDTNKTESYINSLEALLEAYNNANHSSIGPSPDAALNNKSTHQQIRQQLQKH